MCWLNPWCRVLFQYHHHKHYMLRRMSSTVAWFLAAFHPPSQAQRRIKYALYVQETVVRMLIRVPEEVVTIIASIFTQITQGNCLCLCQKRPGCVGIVGLSAAKGSVVINIAPINNYANGIKINQIRESIVSKISTIHTRNNCQHDKHIPHQFF